MSGNTKEPSSGGRASVPSQSYMWFNGTCPCELGQYCGGIYKLLCVCVWVACAAVLLIHSALSLCCASSPIVTSSKSLLLSLREVLWPLYST